MRRTTTEPPDPRHERYLFVVSLALLVVAVVLLWAGGDRHTALGSGCVGAVVVYWFGVRLNGGGRS